MTENTHIAELTTTTDTDGQHTGEVYRLRYATILDIAKKVPPARVAQCMAELTELVLQTHAAWRATVEECKVAGIDPEKVFQFPEYVDWTDDGKGECTTRVFTRVVPS